MQLQQKPTPNHNAPNTVNHTTALLASPQTNHLQMHAHRNGASGVKYREKDDVFYFASPHSDRTGSTSDRRSGSESARTSTSSSRGRVNSREMMALIPARDITQEGPRRVYKWEDF